MSYRDEVGLLMALRLKLDHNGGLALPIAGLEASFEKTRREAMIASLQDDLVRSPLLVARHREWVERDFWELPTWARPSARTDAAANVEVERGTPWQRARDPVLSARLTRIDSLEVASLPLLDPRSQDSIIEATAEKALVHFFRVLGPRERLSYMAALDGARSANVSRLLGESGETVESTLQMSVLTAFKAGFARAARSARDGAHLFERFGRFLLAAALSGRFGVEADALVQTRSLTTARRLARALARRRAADTHTAEAARSFLREALARTPDPVPGPRRDGGTHE